MSPARAPAPILRYPLALTAALAVVAGARVGWASSETSDAHGKASQNVPAAAPQDATRSGSNGIDLGEFQIRTYHPAESQKSVVRFALYATVEKGQLHRSRELLEHRKQKIRDQVIVATRLVPLVDFDEPDLKCFRRRILLLLRRALPELAIDNVYVSDFQLSVERI